MPVQIFMKLKLPLLPNFLRIEGMEESGIDIADVEDHILEDLGKEWTKELLKHAAHRRIARNDPRL